jgi:hypothetical protein
MLSVSSSKCAGGGLCDIRQAFAPIASRPAKKSKHCISMNDGKKSAMCVCWACIVCDALQQGSLFGNAPQLLEPTFARRLVCVPGSFTSLATCAYVVERRDVRARCARKADLPPPAPSTAPTQYRRPPPTPDPPPPPAIYQVAIQWIGSPCGPSSVNSVLLRRTSWSSYRMAFEFFCPRSDMCLCVICSWQHILQLAHGLTFCTSMHARGCSGSSSRGSPRSRWAPVRKRFLCQLPLWFYIYVAAMQRLRAAPRELRSTLFITARVIRLPFC